MRSAKVICIILAVALAVCLPLMAYAKPPLKSYIYGVVYQSGGNSAYYPLQIIPVSNMTFGVRASATYEVCTLVNFYFRADVEGFTSFHLRMKRLSTEYQDASGGLGSYSIFLRKLDSNGGFSDSVNIRTSVQTYREVIDGYTYYDWLYTTDNPVGSQDVIQVTIPFQSFIFGTGSSMYFEVLDFSANGMSSDEIEVNKYQQQFQERLTRLEDIEDRAYQQGKDIPVTDIQQYLSRTDGDHYFSAFHYMFAQSTLLSTMVTVVCLFGIIGFIIYGKKV